MSSGKHALLILHHFAELSSSTMQDVRPWTLTHVCYAVQSIALFTMCNTIHAPAHHVQYDVTMHPNANAATAATSAVLVSACMHACTNALTHGHMHGHRAFDSMLVGFRAETGRQFHLTHTLTRVLMSAAASSALLNRPATWNTLPRTSSLQAGRGTCRQAGP